MAKNVTLAKRFMSLMESMEGARGGEKLEVTEVKKILLSQAVLLTNMHKTVLKAAETVRAEREKIEALTDAVSTELAHRESTVTLLNKIVLLLSDGVKAPQENSVDRRSSKKRRVQANDEREDEERDSVKQQKAESQPLAKKRRVQANDEREDEERSSVKKHIKETESFSLGIEPFDAVDLDDDDAFKQLFN